MCDSKDSNIKLWKDPEQVDVNKGDQVLKDLTEVIHGCEEFYSLKIKPGKISVNLGAIGDKKKCFLEFMCAIRPKEESEKLKKEVLKKIGGYFLDREKKILADLAERWELNVSFCVLDDYVTPQYDEDGKGVIYTIKIIRPKDPLPSSDRQVH